MNKMVKDIDQKTEQENPIDWLKEFTSESITKSAEVDIKPKLTIDSLGIEFAKKVIILSEPYQVEIPKEKAIGNSNKIWMINLEYENTVHQFICQSGSFRFQLGVLMKKLEYTLPSELIGLPIRIWKTVSYINTPKFKGNAEVYQVSIL